MKFSIILVALAIMITTVIVGGSSGSVTKADTSLAQSGEEGPRSSKEPLGTIVNKQSFSRDWVLGSLLKQSLEAMHFSKKKLSDEVSIKAFKVLIEKLDFTKQFLLQKDIKSLKKYEKLLDDELTYGNFESVIEGEKILKARAIELEAYVNKLLAQEKPFDFKKTEKLETDPDKRDYLSSMDELKDLWRRILKYETLNRYTNLKDEQESPVEEDKKSKKKKTTKKEKKLSEAELIKKAQEEVGKTYKRVFKRIAKEKKRDELDKFFNSITRIYDPHTSYLTPEDKEDFDIRMSGKLEGIGAVLREEGSYVKVERIILGSASWKQKELAAEDIILKVAQDKDEPVSIVDMGLQDAVKLIRGKKGTVVKLTVKKPTGLIKIIPIKRDVVEIEDTYVKDAMIDYNKGTKVGYIYVPSFYRDFSNPRGRNATKDVLAAIKRVNKMGAKALILDLRNNGGGALEDARGISGLFIPEGPIVQVKDQRGTIEVLEDNDGEIFFDKPLVVLVNRFSASASEIVAAALQDYGRAVVIGGEHSHGKGTVQAVLDLDNSGPLAAPYRPLGSLKLTIQKFYRVNGVSTQKLGVTPDIVLPDRYGHLETGEMYLDYALSSSTIPSKPFKAWKKKYDLGKLNKMSRARVSKSENFKKINDSVAWYKKRKEDTVKNISYDSFVKEREEIKKSTDLLKLDDVIKGINIKSIDKTLSAVDKDKFKDFSETLQKDPYMKETILILEDMLKL